MSAELYREFVLTSKEPWAALVKVVKDNYQAFLERENPLRIILTTGLKKRTDIQNRLLWGYVYKTIAEQAWVDGKQYDADVWHEYFARKYWVCDEKVLPGGEIVIVRKSTTQMNVGEFSKYMQEVETEAATEYGVIFE